MLSDGVFGGLSRENRRDVAGTFRCLMARMGHRTRIPRGRSWVIVLSHDWRESEMCNFARGNASPYAGVITSVYSNLQGAALAAGDCILTGNIAATPITNGVITITEAGSAQGDWGHAQQVEAPGRTSPVRKSDRTGGAKDRQRKRAGTLDHAQLCPIPVLATWTSIPAEGRDTGCRRGMARAPGGPLDRRLCGSLCGTSRGARGACAADREWNLGEDGVYCRAIADGTLAKIRYASAWVLFLEWNDGYGQRLLTRGTREQVERHALDVAMHGPVGGPELVDQGTGWRRVGDDDTLRALGAEGRHVATGGGNLGRRIHLRQTVDGGTHDVVGIGRAVRLRNHVGHADNLEHGTHGATSDYPSTF